jgi:antitoxin MazE
MKVRVRKWGNSLAMRIPRSFAKEARIEQDNEVNLSLEEGDWWSSLSGNLNERWSNC